MLEPCLAARGFLKTGAMQILEIQTWGPLKKNTSTFESRILVLFVFKKPRWQKHTHKLVTACAVLLLPPPPPPPPSALPPSSSWRLMLTLTSGQLVASTH
jgi:hypothetical protein